MLRREEVGAAMTAMGGLSGEDRELLSLRFGGELEIAELARNCSTCRRDRAHAAVAGARAVAGADG